MDRMMEYKIINEGGMRDLVQATNQHIAEGWRPLGGPIFFVHWESDEWFAYQAMVKEKDEG